VRDVDKVGFVAGASASSSVTALRTRTGAASVGRVAAADPFRPRTGCRAVRAPDLATALFVGMEAAFATGWGRCFARLVVGEAAEEAAAGAGAVWAAAGREEVASSGVLRRLARSPDARAAPAARAPCEP
jgi:hypothetical protein